MDVSETAEDENDNSRTVHEGWQAVFASDPSKKRTLRGVSLTFRLSVQKAWPHSAALCSPSTA
jgi:hypothetical protein